MWKLNWTELGIDLDRLKEVLTYDAAQPMIFSSGFFLLLFLGFSLVYLLLQKRTTARLLFVTLFSYYFYYKSSGTYFFLLGIVTVSDFLLARRMEMTVEHWKRKMLVVCSLCINLGLLCYFKYTNFFYEMLAPLWNGRFEPLDIFLPVGISFFTFQSLSYTIDVYRRDLKPLSSLLDYAFYVSFFPQLVAGPIVRARDFIPQIRRPLSVTSEMKPSDASKTVDIHERFRNLPGGHSFCIHRDDLLINFADVLLTFFTTFGSKVDFRS